MRSLQKGTGEKSVDIQTPEFGEQGDYSSNIAMQMFSQFPIKGIKNPRQLAEKIVEKLNEDKDLKKIVNKIEVAGPGFINFWLKKEVLVSELTKVLSEAEKYGSSNLGKGKTVVIDYSSPNIAKRFGIGHLRSTIIGQALYNLYSFLDYKAIGDNHLGDWGTQFGVLLAQIAITKSSKLKARNLNIDKLEELYVEFNKKAEENPRLWDEARNWFKKLEEGDKDARKIWKEIVEISVKDFERIYDVLGINIDNAYGESFYEDKMPQAINLLRKKGLTKKSEGAEIVELSKLTPAILVKSDGATTYYTRDLATLKFRIQEWNPDLIIYEVGSEQTLHFRQLFETAKLLGLDKGRSLVHVAHGLIRFKSGKMSTRRGQTIKLEDVLNEATLRAKKIIKASETSRGLSNNQQVEVAKVVGIGAIKYFDLMHHPASDIIFEWEKMFVLEGNSAPYLQYTYARCQSVLRKATFKGGSLQGTYNLNQKVNKEEGFLLRAFVHFPEVIEDAAKNFSPNLVCNYLFDLAQKFNTFYNNHRIIGSDQENARLAITSATGQILKNGLKLLGIDTPERM